MDKRAVSTVKDMIAKTQKLLKGKLDSYEREHLTSVLRYLSHLLPIEEEETNVNLKHAAA